MDKHTRDAMNRADEMRRFPPNTCPASRHAQMIGEALARRKRYVMLEDEPDHCGGSILSTVASLYEARSENARLRTALIQIRDVCTDNAPPSCDKGMALAFVRGVADANLGGYVAVSSDEQSQRPKVVGRVTGTIYDGDQVPGMPGAICHACGLKDYPCTNPDCPRSS